MKTNERTVDWPPARRASLHSIATPRRALGWPVRRPRHRPPENRAGGAGPAAAQGTRAHPQRARARPRRARRAPPRRDTHARATCRRGRAGQLPGAVTDRAQHGTGHTFRLPGTAYATALPASTYATTGYTYSASYRLSPLRVWELPQACPCSRRLRRNSSAGGTALETALDLRGGGGGSSP